MSLPLVENIRLRDDLHRVPHLFYRLAKPSAPWPWTDLNDGAFIDRKRHISILVLM